MSDSQFHDLLFEALGEGGMGDALHPRVLAIGMQVARDELTHVQARVALRATLADIETQERRWEHVFVN